MAIEKIPSENRDPISGALGAHPIGTGVGAAVVGAAAGAATGTVAGPVGSAVGAAVGAVIGGLAGKGVGEKINPTADAVQNDVSRPYPDSDNADDHYAPAYRFGSESRARMPDASWEEAEIALRRDWENYPHPWTLDWNAASHAVKDAWDRGTGLLEPGMTQTAANE